jgi:hypothetical protein
MVMPVGKKPKPPRQPSAVNPRHQVVVDAVMEGASPTNALRAAGYHPGSAAEVMRSETVQQMLAEARGEVEDLTTLKRMDVLNMFLEAIDMSRTLSDPANMINGADKIAKMLGYYAPETKRIELTTDQSVLSSKFRAMSDADLLEVASGRARLISGEVVA